MEELLGPAFVKGVYAIFKGKPNQAFIVVVVITNIVLGIWVLTAKNPDDRTYGVIAIVFVFLATLSRVVNIMVQERLRGIQGEVEEPVEEETAEQPAPAPIELPLLVQEMLPPTESPPMPQVNQAASPVAPEKKKFSYFGMNVSDILQAILISFVAAFAGYLLAYLLGLSMLISYAEGIIPSWDASTTADAQATLGSPLFQMICGLSAVGFLMTPVCAIFLLLIGFLVKNRPGLVKGLIAIPSFLFGAILFPLLQFPLLIGAYF